MSTEVFVAIVIALLLTAFTLVVLAMSARRRRETRSTIGLPDVGAVTGDDPPPNDHAAASRAPRRRSDHSQ